MMREEVVMLCTSDIAGQIRGKGFPASDLAARLAKGIGWTPTNIMISAHGAIAPSPWGALGDLVIKPDPATRVRVDFGSDQAAEHFIGDIMTEQLRTLSAYLEANAGQYAGLQNSVPIVTQAAHRFAARDYAQAFNLIWLAYRAIEAARLADPKVPPPRAASVDQTLSSVH